MSPLLTPDGHELVVGLLAGGNEGEDSPDNRRLLRLEPLQTADVALARDETFLAGFCCGALTAAQEELDWRLEPGESTGRDRVKGYSVVLRHGSRLYRKSFPTRTLAAAARRAALQLRDQELLGSSEEYSFFLTTRPAEKRSDATLGDVLMAKRIAEPLRVESEPLAPWLERSRVYVGPVGVDQPHAEDQQPDETLPVFIPRRVWDEAYTQSRRGGENESAAALVGYLARDPETAAVFLIVTECLPADHAVEEQYSVGFSGETWGVLRARVEQRRRKLNRPAEMIVGTAHGHNFKPSPDATGRMTCEACPAMEICSRSTCHASDDDLRFHQSVFTQAPWALLLLHGWNARDQEEWRLYGLKDATLTPRSVRIVDE